MHPNERVAKNPRLLFWGRALVETKILAAIVVLFYLHRGITLEEIFYLSIVWSLTALAVEVPSGYLADAIGRKRTLLLGVLLLLASQGVTFFAHGFWPFALTFVLMSASFSCFSGTEEAMLYESLEQTGCGREINARNGKQLAARSLPDILVPAIGAFIARDLTEGQFQLLIGLNMAIAFIALVVLSRLTEPTRAKSVAEREIGIFATSIKTIRHQPWLLKVAFNKILVFIAVFVTWRTSQPLLSGLGFGAETLGVFYVLFQSIEFTCGWFAGVLERMVGAVRIIFFTPAFMVILFTLAIISDEPWIVFVSLVLSLAMNNLRDAMFSHAVNTRIHSTSRATTLSNLNVIKGIIDIPVLLLAGLLAKGSVELPLYLAIGLCLIVLLVFPIRKHELLTA